jgi:hypothetical protein
LKVRARALRRHLAIVHHLLGAREILTHQVVSAASTSTIHAESSTQPRLVMLCGNA